MAAITREEADRLAEIIATVSATQSERQALLYRAFQGHRLLNRLDLSSTPYVFSNHLVATLLNYGELEPGIPALVFLIDALKEQFGVDKQSELNYLSEKLLGEEKQTELTDLAEKLRHYANENPEPPHREKPPIIRFPPQEGKIGREKIYRAVRAVLDAREDAAKKNTVPAEM